MDVSFLRFILNLTQFFVDIIRSLVMQGFNLRLFLDGRYFNIIHWFSVSDIFLLKIFIAVLVLSVSNNPFHSLQYNNLIALL